MTSIERQRAIYGLSTLRQLKAELASMPVNQLKKYPKETSWIPWEIEKWDTILGKEVNIHG
jgi:hypothetical protein